MNEAAQEGCQSISNTYTSGDPIGLDDCALHFGAIATIVIFTPPAQGVKIFIKWALL